MRVQCRLNCKPHDVLIGSLHTTADAKPNGTGRADNMCLQPMIAGACEFGSKSDVLFSVVFELPFQ